MNAPETAQRTLAELCRAPRDEDGPIFAEPWQAKAFSLTLALHERGHLSWPDWTSALATEIAAASDSDYYGCWLAALEKLTVAKGLVGSDELLSRIARN